jgi:hypothetical protein
MRIDNKYSLFNKIGSISFVKLIIGIDVFIISCTLIRYDFGELLNNAFLGWLIPKFDLAVEMNFAIWWSSILLFLIGFLAYEHFLSEEGDTKKAWLGISIIFIGLSIDEMSSLHERIIKFCRMSDEWLLLAPIALAFFVILSYSLIKLLWKRESRYSAILMSVVFVLFFSLPFQEYLEFTVNWPDWMRGLRIIIEEGTELVGSLIGLIAVAIYPNRKAPRQLQNLTPKGSTIKQSNYLLCTFFVIHFFLSFTVFSWNKLENWGNPFVWYPMIVYFIAFLYLVQKLLRGSPDHYYFLILSAILLCCSTLIPYVFTTSLKLSFYPEKSIFDATFLISFHTLQIFMCVLLFLNHLHSPTLVRSLIILIFVNILLGLIFFRNLILVFIIIGFNSYIYFYLITFGFSVQKK